MPAPCLPERPRRSSGLGAAPAAGLLLPALLSACGGSAPVSTASAKAQLISVADRVDACYAKQLDTRKCTDVDALGDLGDAQLGDGDGKVAVNATRPTRYQLTLKVDDRTTFAILVQPVGARKRVCTPAGEGGCPKGGVW